MSYETRWLLLGLETVFGETIPVPTGTPWKITRIDRGLRTFVSEVVCVGVTVRCVLGGVAFFLCTSRLDCHCSVPTVL